MRVGARVCICTCIYFGGFVYTNVYVSLSFQSATPTQSLPLAISKSIGGGFVCRFLTCLCLFPCCGVSVGRSILQVEPYQWCHLMGGPNANPTQRQRLDRTGVKRRQHYAAGQCAGGGASSSSGGGRGYRNE